MIPDLNGTWFKLNNSHVENALAGYDSSRTEILNFLLAEYAFKGSGAMATGPFGFDLQRVDRVRQAIKRIVAPRQTSASKRISQIDAFRRELVYATTDATRRDQTALVLHLYTALMERHGAHPPRTGPDDPSEAGEYLLRCLVVHAAYDNIGTYRFVLEQFARVVAALRMCPNEDFAHMCEPLLSVAQQSLSTIEAQLRGVTSSLVRRKERWPLVAVKCGTTVPDGYKGDQLLRRARELGGVLAMESHATPRARWVVVLRGEPSVTGRSVAGQLQLGAIEAGGRVITIAQGDRQRWASTGQTLELTLTDESDVKRLLTKADKVIQFPDGEPAKHALPPVEAPSRQPWDPGSAAPAGIDDSLWKAWLNFVSAPYAPGS